MESVVTRAKASRALLGEDAEKPIVDGTPIRNAAAATGWGEANSEGDATDDESEEEVDQGSGEESWLARQLRLARVS